MTVGVVVALAAGIYATRLTGMFALSRWQHHPLVEAALRLVPVSVMAAVVALQIFTSGRELGVDARAWGAVAAALAAWRRQPLVVVLVAAASVTAVVRAAGIAG